MTLSAVQSFYIPAVAVTTIPGITISNLDSSGLRIEWSVSRDNTNKPDTGEIIVFNLSPTLISTIQEAWNFRQFAGFTAVPDVVLAVGWNRVPEIVLQGDIVEFIPNRRTPTDVLTVWRVGDGLEQMRDSTVGRSLHNVKIAVLLEPLVTLPPNTSDIGLGGLGLIFPPESAALITTAVAEIPFQDWSNITPGMSTKIAIDFIMETLGLEWRIHNGTFVALRGGLINRPGPVISPQSGLIEYTPKDDGGITFTALADSRFEPGIRFTVLDNLGKPIGSPSYRLESVAFTGSTDENSLMSVVGRRPLLL